MSNLETYKANTENTGRFIDYDTDAQIRAKVSNGSITTEQGINEFMAASFGAIKITF